MPAPNHTGLNNLADCGWDSGVSSAESWCPYCQVQDLRANVYWKAEERLRWWKASAEDSGSIPSCPRGDSMFL